MIKSPSYRSPKYRSAFVANAVLALLLALGLSSCFKEKPIKQPNIYNGTDVFVANMGGGYIKQLYFNFQTFQFTDSNSHYLYDMAFDCDPTSYNVWINGSKLMFACHTGKYNLSEVTSLADSAGNGWKEELGAGIPAENAIGAWSNYGTSRKEVYILNLGTDSAGNQLGYKKMQLGDCTGNTYSVTYSNLDGSASHTISVPRRENRNKIYLSLLDQQVRDLEPDYTNWDIIFTRYSVYFAEEHLPYQVTGVLTNPHKTVSYFMDSTSNFDSITINNVSQGKFTPLLDNIGYEWKRYGLGTTGAYTILSNFNYIIKSDTRYYKLRFIDFYNANASEGYPKFQVDELK